MLSLLLKLRWLAVVVVVFSALHSVAFIGIGVMRGIEGYRLLFEGPPWEGSHTPGVHLGRSIDAFLISMVFFVFSIGIGTLFLIPPNDPRLQQIPRWMQVHDLAELKFLIWEAILAALVVASIEAFVTERQQGWAAMSLPLAVFVLSAGLYLARRSR
jgi:uncharacterized membrane protein YqhA